MGNDVGYLIAIILGLLFSFGLPLILISIGFFLRKKKRKQSKTFYIIGIVYLLISLGVCGSLMI